MPIAEIERELESLHGDVDRHTALIQRLQGSLLADADRWQGRSVERPAQTPNANAIYAYSVPNDRWEIAAPSAATAHDILSASHLDTVGASVVRGDLLTGQGAPATWQRLAVGASGTVLKSDGTDAAWSAFAHAIGGADHTGSLTAALHGTFAGDDLHTQYLLAAGTRALTGDWDAGAFKITANEFRLNDSEPITFGNLPDSEIKWDTVDLLVGKTGTNVRVPGTFEVTGTTALQGALTMGAGDNINMQSNRLQWIAGIGIIGTNLLDHIVIGASSLEAAATTTIVGDLRINGPDGIQSDIKGIGGTAYIRLFNAAPNVRIPGSFSVSGTHSAARQIFVDGTNNEIQLRVQAHSTQTAKIVSVENSAGVVQFSVDNNGNVVFLGDFGVGTATVPHQGVGAARFAVEGSDASVANGPHVQLTTAADNFPLLQILAFQHDSVTLLFDAYYDGDTKSSDVGSNYTIGKFADALRFGYGSGVAAGSVLSTSIAFDINTAGLVHFRQAVEIDGDLNHDGSNVGFFAIAPASRAGATDDIKDALTTYGLLQGAAATPLDLDGGTLTAGAAIVDSRDVNRYAYSVG